MQKWDVVRIHCDFLTRPHDKFCICICPENRWFLFVNSEPPKFRKAREHAVTISAFEALFLTHDSYVDTTTHVEIEHYAVTYAWSKKERRHGLLMPTLRKRIIDAAVQHEVMEPGPRAKLLAGEQ